MSELYVNIDQSGHQRNPTFYPKAMKGKIYLYFRILQPKTFLACLYITSHNYYIALSGEMLKIVLEGRMISVITII